MLGEITENEGGRGPAKKSRPGPPDSVKIKNRAEDDDIIELEPEQVAAGMYKVATNLISFPNLLFFNLISFPISLRIIWG